MANPYTLKIFLPDGEPDGVRCISKTGWSGGGLMVPRSKLTAVKGREEFSRPGVYILAGPSDNGGMPTVYVGEGATVIHRLESHLKTKDFWTLCIFFTANDGSLNKAHIQHLESRLVKKAQDAKRCELDNSTTPTLPSLSESERADSENFLQEILSILPLMGIDVFEMPDSLVPAVSSRIMTLKGKDVVARGYESNSGFVVTTGSEVVLECKVTDTCPERITGLRKTLESSGVMALRDTHYVFQQEYEFNSPSLAASVVLGGTASGRALWKNAQEQSLNDIQAALVEGAIEDGK